MDAAPSNLNGDTFTMLHLPGTAGWKHLATPLLGILKALDWVSRLICGAVPALNPGPCHVLAIFLSLPIRTKPLYLFETAWMSDLVILIPYAGCSWTYNIIT